MTPEFTHTAHLKDCNMGAVTYQCAKILADSLVKKTSFPPRIAFQPFNATLNVFTLK